MAVAATAIEIGKNIEKTGNKMVPKPKPEKNVKPDAKAAIKNIATSSISDPH
jgi:hypothetical protein